MAELMPLPLTVCWFSKIQIGFTFLVPAHPGSPGQRAVKLVYVCVEDFFKETINKVFDVLDLGLNPGFETHQLKRFKPLSFIGIH